VTEREEFILVEEYGWRMGLSNMVRKEFTAWFGSTAWWKQALIWSIVLSFIVVGGAVAGPEIGLVMFVLMGSIFMTIATIIASQEFILEENWISSLGSLEASIKNSIHCSQAISKRNQSDSIISLHSGSCRIYPDVSAIRWHNTFHILPGISTISSLGDFLTVLHNLSWNILRQRGRSHGTSILFDVTCLPIGTYAVYW